MKFEKIEDIWIWRESVDLCDDIFKITGKSRPTLIRDSALSNHLRRTVVSIPSNIAEGHGRNSRADFRRFLFIARGSCVELNTQLIIANKVEELSDKDFQVLENKCKRVCAGIFNLIRYLSKDSNEKSNENT
jgi:four helix bundle protein